MRMETIVDPDRFVSISERQRSVLVLAQALMMAWLTASEWRVTSLRVFLRLTIYKLEQYLGDISANNWRPNDHFIHGHRRQHRRRIHCFNYNMKIQFASNSGILIYFEGMSRITASPGSDCKFPLIADLDYLGK